MIRQRPQCLGLSLLAEASHVGAGGDGGDVLAAVLLPEGHHGPPGLVMSAGVNAIQVLAGFVEDVYCIKYICDSVFVRNVDHVLHPPFHLADSFTVLQ